MTSSNLSTSPRPSFTTSGKNNESIPWYVHLLVGGGVWFGATLVASATVLVFHDVFNGPTAELIGRLVVGLLLLAGATAASRLSSSLLANHITFVASFSGQALVLAALSATDGFLTFSALLQVFLFFAIANRLHRVFSGLSFTFLVMCFPFWGHLIELPRFVLMISIVGMAVGFGFERMVANQLRRGFWVPLAMAMALSANVMLLFFEIFGRKGALGPDYVLPAYLISDAWYVAIAAALVGGILLLIALATGRPRMPVRGKTLAGVGIVLVIAALTRGNVVLLSGLLTLGLAHHSHRRSLSVLGTVSLGLGLWWTYYSLSTTLLVKSLVVTGTGLGLLVALALVIRLFPSTTKSRDAFTWKTRSRLTRDAAMLAGAVALVLVTLGSLTVHKEHIKRTGEVVLLELAPVDPRSLIQGDYMRLDTRVARDIQKAQRRPPRDGRVVITLDANSVAHFVRLESNASTLPALVDDNERVLNFKVRKHRARVGPTEYFFEEGRKKHFQQARYAEMRVSSSGTILLVGLRDEDRDPL